MIESEEWDELQKQLDHLALIQKVKAFNASAKRWIPRLALLVVSVFVILSICPLRTTEIAVEVKLRKIDFRVKRAGFVLEQIPIDRMTLADCVQVEDLVTGISRVRSAQTFSFETTAGYNSSIAIDQIPTGSSISVSLDGKELTLTVGNNTATKSPKVRLLTSDATDVRNLALSSGGSLLLSLSLNGDLPLRIAKSEVNAVRFVESNTFPEAVLGSFASGSSITDGKIDFLEVTSNSHTLKPNDSIGLESPNGSLSIQAGPEGLICRFVGTVRKVSAGRFGHEKSLQPTYLQWIQFEYSSALMFFALVPTLLIAYNGLIWLSSTFLRS